MIALYYVEEKDELVLHILCAEIAYHFEIHGKCDRLVITGQFLFLFGFFVGFWFCGTWFT